ncbi:MAG: hypothetical protein JWN43_3623 [Gammaproteobacteria bacterium]|nr:hypothetical protein [Gammaproteobacteria bacterium]
MSHEQRVSDLAYRLWQARGCPEGSPEVDWAEAERQIANQADSSQVPADDIDGPLKDSFPASDPPASHLPDEPPSNADEKWAAAGINSKRSRTHLPG